MEKALDEYTTYKQNGILHEMGARTISRKIWDTILRLMMEKARTLNEVALRIDTQESREQDIAYMRHQLYPAVGYRHASSRKVRFFKSCPEYTPLCGMKSLRNLKKTALVIRGCDVLI